MFSLAGCKDNSDNAEEATSEPTLTAETVATDEPEVTEEPEKTEEPADKEEKKEEKAAAKPEETKAPENQTAAAPELTAAPAAAEVPEASVDLSAVRSAIISKVGISDAMMLETPALMNLYGISSSQVKQSASFVTMSGVFPHEIIMVEAVDSSAASAVQSALQNRLNEVLVQSETYDAENYAIAQQCSVIRNDCFVALLLSPDQAAMKSVYAGYVK